MKYYELPVSCSMGMFNSGIKYVADNIEVLVNISYGSSFSHTIQRPRYLFGHRLPLLKRDICSVHGDRGHIDPQMIERFEIISMSESVLDIAIMGAYARSLYRYLLNGRSHSQ